MVQRTAHQPVLRRDEEGVHEWVVPTVRPLRQRHSFRNQIMAVLLTPLALARSFSLVQHVNAAQSLLYSAGARGCCSTAVRIRSAVARRTDFTHTTRAPVRLTFPEESEVVFIAPLFGDPVQQPSSRKGNCAYGLVEIRGFARAHALVAPNVFRPPSGPSPGPSPTPQPECAGYHRAIFYRSSLDANGTAWGPIHRLDGNSGGCLTDPAPVWDAIKSQLIVQYSARGATETWQIVSRDYGTSWAAPTLLNQMLGPAAGFRPGPAGGLALTTGPNTGRLLYAGYCHLSDGSCSGVSVWSSDNSGATWGLASVNSTADKCDKSKHRFTPNVGEPQLVQLPDGRVLLDMRVEGASHRRAAQSLDGGLTFNEATAPAGSLLPDTKTGCMGL